MKQLNQFSEGSLTVTLFWWNQKFILKFEQNQLEQTYKISELDYSETEVLELAQNQEFLESVKKRFEQMFSDLQIYLQTY
ncbi:hypothetical protein [Raineya orbicola]|uniref:Uncharacterized protein n=1 Tax=Raineya orbicola TaxID=2016530 RepID=A0A2N3IKJ1_9BACT|nr:hypothetical protein [Raineya orbicola]PKQ70778.1 hypothetical protein Rain11_0124 [Raineya orbicola]